MALGIFKKKVQEHYIDEGGPGLEGLKAEKNIEELTLEEEIFRGMKDEFVEVDGEESLKQSTSPRDPPILVMRTDYNPVSVWHRLPVRGASGAKHIPDFVIYSGSHKVPPAGKNPELIIECRQMPDEASNRIDARAVGDLVAKTVDLLPSNAILVTNRQLADYAKSFASQYGIALMTNDLDLNGKVSKIINAHDRKVQGKLREHIEKAIKKLGSLETSRAPRKAPEEGSKAEVNLGQQISDALGAQASMNADDIASVLKIPSSVIVNELYKLERTGKVGRVANKNGNAESNVIKQEWALKKKD
ncbi:MAG: hypothetical protein QF775_02915 [archaeon]|jgi:hypothetical protein|nr:hypothetical protein [Euryarchaeota archaeon]MDP6704411.1 hypothetical protein [archaeon]|tara:strand:- start:20492 stop:21400 length:909 start_codon:yes stop_codon:yes gene_type:complete